jgi:hypothetical protein
MPVSKGPKGVAQEMRKFKAGKLHSGSKTGPVVKDRKQAIAIALNEAGMSKKKGMAMGGAVKGCPMCGMGKGKCTCGKGGYAKGGAVKKGGSSCRGMGKATKGGKFSGTY